MSHIAELPMLVTACPHSPVGRKGLGTATKGWVG